MAKHSSFPMVSHWFPRLADLRRNTHDKVLTSQTGLAMVSCFSVQRPQTTGIIQQEVTVYFDCAHGMAIQIFVAAMHTLLRILFPVYSHMINPSCGNAHFTKNSISCVQSHDYFTSSREEWLSVFKGISKDKHLL